MKRKFKKYLSIIPIISPKGISIFHLEPGAGVQIDVGGANIQIAHYFNHGYLEEGQSMIHSFSYFWSKVFDRHCY